MSLIAVVLKAPSSQVRNNEITQLLNFGFSNYTVKTFANKGDIIQSANINKYIGGTVNIVYEDTASLVVEKGTDLNVTSEIVLDSNLCAPLSANQVVGEVVFKDASGNVLSKTNAVISEDVPRSNFMEYLRYTFNSYLMATFT